MLAFCPTDSKNKIENAHFYDASVVKYDKKRDLALLKINSPIKEKIIKIIPAVINPFLFICVRSSFEIFSVIVRYIGRIPKGLTSVNKELKHSIQY